MCTCTTDCGVLPVVAEAAAAASAAAEVRSASVGGKAGGFGTSRAGAFTLHGATGAIGDASRGLASARGGGGLWPTAINPELAEPLVATNCRPTEPRGAACRSDFGRSVSFPGGLGTSVAATGHAPISTGVGGAPIGGKSCFGCEAFACTTSITGLCDLANCTLRFVSLMMC